MMQSSVRLEDINIGAVIHLKDGRHGVVLVVETGAEIVFGSQSKWEVMEKIGDIKTKGFPEWRDYYRVNVRISGKNETVDCTMIERIGSIHEAF